MNILNERMIFIRLVFIKYLKFNKNVPFQSVFNNHDKYNQDDFR